MKIKISLLTLLFISVLNFTAFSQQRGKASYYADRFHGRKTTSGAHYHRDSLTCAHKTYPFGTLLLVRNLTNDKEVVVKVTDRGPHTRNRLLDLSYAAAKKIGLTAQGIGMVEITKWIPPVWNFKPLPIDLHFDKLLPVKKTVKGKVPEYSL